MRQTFWTWWPSIRDDPARREANLAGAASDAVGLQVDGCMWALLVLGKTLLQERLPGLALRACTFSLATLAAARLALRQPSIYAAKRERIYGGLMLHVVMTSLDGALHGGTNFLVQHKGSPLLLLAFLCIHNAALWAAIGALYARLPLRFNAVLLPLLATIPAAASPALCRRMLDAPGGAASVKPLSSLYSGLVLAHNAIAAPGLVQVLLHFHQSDTSSQQCLRVSLWSVALLGVALPLLILQRIGQLCQEQQQRRQGRQQEEQPPPQQARQQTPPGSLLLSLYTYSVFVWQLLLLIT